MESFTRRMALQATASAGALLGLGKSQEAMAAVTGNGRAVESVDGWRNTHDRVWLGGQFWANPMEDWRVKDGAAESLSAGGDRNIQLITHEFVGDAKPFHMSVRVSQVERGKQEASVGFRMGVRADINEHRANCFAKNGVNIGLQDGSLVIAGKSAKLPGPVKLQDVVLRLEGQALKTGYQLTLSLLLPDQDKPLATVSALQPVDQLAGNVALVNNFDPALKPGQGSRYRFQDWQVTGEAFTVRPERKFGPLLWGMYSLSDSRGEDGWVMKISALTGPLGKKDNHEVELQVMKKSAWTSLGVATLDPEAWTATFRVANWDEKSATPYKLIYRERHPDGAETADEWTGNIRANPSGRPLRIGTLTCQNDYAFPYQPVAENLLKLDPDLLYFSGDQLYENHGGYGIIRDPAEPAILNYLRKYYQHGWAFREAMRDRPTLCIPDDHDVFQGNIWGEGGAKMTSGSTSSKGGYREPARMVNVVHKTNAAHHPDYYDPTPVKQNISVYYGDMVYGGVSFAILGDRQFKSGPERVETGSGRADHVLDPAFDCAKLDQPGLVLLGERQEKFLEHWAGDWRGHTMKVLLSQTVFAGVATHHGGYNGYLKADLDSGGWPQTARDRTVRLLRKAMPLHINGDQHLTTLVQYGVEQQRDSNWSFCPPAIAVGYPRWWRPDELTGAAAIPHKNRPRHNLPHTGEFIDGFGNKVYLYAVGNPEVATERNRYDRAHQKGSGFGLVTIDTEAKTYTICSYKFLVDATEDKPENQFPGWPVTLHQKENGGENVIG